MSNETRQLTSRVLEECSQETSSSSAVSGERRGRTLFPFAFVFLLFLSHRVFIV